MSRRIDDFGEKIAGARKDAYTRWNENFTEQTGQGLRSIRKEPLSKSWPEPSYVRLAEQSPLIAFWLRALREQIPSKPRGRYAGVELERWSIKSYIFREYAKKLIDNIEYYKDLGHDAIYQELEVQLTEIKNNGRRVQIYDPAVENLKRYKAEGAQFDYSIIEDEHEISPYYMNVLFMRAKSALVKAKIYEHFTTGKGLDYNQSLANIKVRNTISRDDEEKILIGVYERSNSRRALSRKVYDVWELDKLMHDLEENELVQNLLKGKDPKGKSANKRKNIELSVLSSRELSSRSSSHVVYLIATKHRGKWVVLDSFKSTEEAKKAFFNSDKREAYNEAFEKWRAQGRVRLRSTDNAPRSGHTWRVGDVSPELFSDTFGFRGVQFGNYVGDNRRQEDLNEAFDALVDMAYVLDVDPKALSLQGTLGLAFGARGRGGPRAAAAHYEPAQTVINLTKTRGAGSLAHEWFHALDNFLGEQETLKAGTYLTQIDSTLIPYLLKRERNKSVAHAFFADLAENTKIIERSQTLDVRRTQPYWSSPVEVAARSFESAMKYELANLDMRNDYLVNILDDEAIENLGANLVSFTPTESLIRMDSDYPYALKSEAPANAQAMSNLLKRMLDHDAFKERFNLDKYLVKDLFNQETVAENEFLSDNFERQEHPQHKGTPSLPF